MSTEPLARDPFIAGLLELEAEVDRRRAELDRHVATEVERLAREHRPGREARLVRFLGTATALKLEAHLLPRR